MLGYAIALRINQYDLTMNRYFVVIFGIWLTIISLYFVIGTIKSLTVIPATLTAITLLISVGPWWIYQLPLSRQYNRLVHNLETAGILKDGKISVAPESLDAVLENDIHSGIEYVCRFEDCARIQTLFADILVEAKKTDERNWKENPYNIWKTYTGMNTWTVVSEVTKGIGIEWRDIGMNTNERKYLVYNSKSVDLYEEPLTVSGFDTLYMIHSYYPWDTLPLSGNYVFINTDTEELILKRNNKNEVFSLKEMNKGFMEKYKNNTNLSADELTFTLREKNKTIKIIFQAYAIKNPKFTETSTGEYPHISGYALINE